MNDDLLKLLRSVDTPTVCNAIEVAQGKRGFNDFTRGTMVCSAPGEAMVGYARTARIQAVNPPSEAADVIKARRMAYLEADRFSSLIDAITEMTIEYLCGQIEAGVDAVQLFDSWAGSLSPAQFERWVIKPNAQIVRGVKARYPDTPIIGFPKGAGGKISAYAEKTGVDAIGIDETVDPVWANSVLPENIPVQGNLDPLALIAGGEALEEAVANIRSAFAGRPHIFNLGHGIQKDTPIEHVEKLLTLVRQ